jgi:ABC-2 type transport system permease protein
LEKMRRLLIIFRKTLKEMSRDLWMLGLTLAFAPFFVMLYWLWSQGGSTSYSIVVINQDVGTTLPGGARLLAGEQVIEAISRMAYADGKPLLKVVHAVTQAEAESILKDRDATAFILLPPEFSQSILDLQNNGSSPGAQIIFGGDLSNPYYMVAANLALVTIDQYVQAVSGRSPLVDYHEIPLGGALARTEFEIYVPGTLMFAVILLVFLASMTVAREIETGTLRRLQLTPMTSFELLGGMSMALVLVGIISTLLSFSVAILLGFRSQGPLWVAVLVAAVTSLSIIGLGMVVACFSRTVSQAFVVANFPLGLMMFFSGVIYPLPRVALFTIAGHSVGLYDILPPTHAVAALNKVLTQGAGLDEVIWELTSLTILSVIYFLVGAWLFRRMHLRTG